MIHRTAGIEENDLADFSRPWVRYFDEFNGHLTAHSII